MGVSRSEEDTEEERRWKRPPPPVRECLVGECLVAWSWSEEERDEERGLKKPARLGEWVVVALGGGGLVCSSRLWKRPILADVKCYELLLCSLG